MQNNYDSDVSIKKRHWILKLPLMLPISVLVIFAISALWMSFIHSQLQGKSQLDVLNNVFAPLLVASLTGAFAWLGGRFKTMWEYRQKVDAAPRAYVNELDKLINQAYFEGFEKAVVNARAIVAARNSLRSTLMSISKQLNSEIDKLATDLGETGGHFDSLQSSLKNENERDPKRIFETLEVLVRIWPAKKVQIEVEIRKLMAELGLDYSSVT